MQRRRSNFVVAAAAALWAGAAGAQEILRDDFNGPSLDLAKWQVMTHQVGRTSFGFTPVVSDGYARLRHDTYNPTAPGIRFRGTELKSIETISRGATGIELESRVRVNPMSNGLVTSFFTYNYRVQNGTGFSDEMDFEFLSSRINATPNSADPVLVSTYNDFNNTTQPYGDEVTQSTREIIVDPLNLSQFNTFKMRWLPQRLEWYANGRLLRTVTGSLVPTDPTTLRFNFWAPGAEWPAAYSSSLNPTSNPAQNVSAFYDLDWTVVRQVRPAVGASAPDRVFTDRFNNGNVSSSDTIPGFWTTRNQGASSSVIESTALPLRLTAGGAGFPHAQLASGVRSDFNFFESPIEIEATGIDFSSPTGSYNKSYLRFSLSSQTLSSGTQSEYTVEDAFSLRIGGDNSVALGFKVNSPNVNTEFDRVNLLDESVSGPVRRFSLIIHPTFFTLNLEHDLSLTDSTPVTAAFSGALSLDLNEWAILSNLATGDSAMFLQSQLANAAAGESTTVALESMAVNAIRPAWAGAGSGDWNSTVNWSRNMVPNYPGANAILGGTTAQTIFIDAPVTVGKLLLNNPSGFTITGTASLDIQTPARVAKIDVVAGNHQINVPIHLGSDVQVTVGNGLNMTAGGVSADSDVEIEKLGTGALEVVNLRGGSLLISAGSVAVAEGPTGNSPQGASSIRGLTLAGTPSAPSAKLDLANNVMIIDYDTASPIDQVRQLLQAGFAGNGNGIVSSTASTATRIGYVEGSVLLPAGGTFAGQAVDSSSLVLAYALGGDADLDGAVMIGDFAALAARFNQPGLWSDGDFDYDNEVSIGDFAMLAANFNQVLPAARAVPEPGSAAGLLLSALLAIRTRRVTA